MSSPPLRRLSRAGGLLCALTGLLVGVLVQTPAQAAPAKPAPLTTPWTSQALSGTPLPEYPARR